jgi:hypothetical protein
MQKTINAKTQRGSAATKSVFTAARRRIRNSGRKEARSWM